MTEKLKKLWPSVATLGAAAVVFLSPSVQSYSERHAAYSVPLMAIWGLFLHWAQSPAPRTPREGELPQAK